jgi:hypothetical protein
MTFMRTPSPAITPADMTPSSTDVRRSAQTYLARLRHARAKSANAQGSIMRPRQAAPAVTPVVASNIVEIPQNVSRPVAPSLSNIDRDAVLARLRSLGQQKTVPQVSSSVADFALKLASDVNPPAANNTELLATRIEDCVPPESDHVAAAPKTPKPLSTRKPRKTSPAIPSETTAVKCNAATPDPEGDPMIISSIPAFTSPKLTGLAWVRARAEARTRARQAQATLADTRRQKRATLTQERLAKETESRTYRSSARQAMSVASSSSLAAKRDARSKIEVARQAQDIKTTTQRQKIMDARAQRLAERLARTQQLAEHRVALQKAEREKTEKVKQQNAIKAATRPTTPVRTQKPKTKAAPRVKLQRPVRVAQRPESPQSVREAKTASHPAITIPVREAPARDAVARPQSVFATAVRPVATLGSINGLGAAMQRRLVEIGIESANDLVAADPQNIRTQLGPISVLANVERWIDDAKQALSDAA